MSFLSGQETVAPASCIMVSFADGSVVGYRLPLVLTSSGAWEKVQGSVLCLASDGNEIVAIGLSSGHVMIFDRHDMRAVFCSQVAQLPPGAAGATPSRIQLHASSSGHSREILLLARFTDGSLRLWKLSSCRLPGISTCHVGSGFLACAEAPVMLMLQVSDHFIPNFGDINSLFWKYYEARGAGGGSKMSSIVNDATIISLDGDKLIRLWGLPGATSDEAVIAAQPKRILIGTDSSPIALFALQSGRLAGAVCVSGGVVVWSVDNGTVVFKGSMASSSSSSSSFEAHIVEFNGQVRIAASQVNLDSGLRLMLFELNFDGLRPELKCLCRYQNVLREWHLKDICNF